MDRFLLLLHATFVVGLAVRDLPTPPVCSNGLWCTSTDPTGKLSPVMETDPYNTRNSIPNTACLYPMYFNIDMNQEIYMGCEYDSTTGIDVNFGRDNEDTTCPATMACRPPTHTPGPSSAGACFIDCPSASLLGASVYDVWSESSFLECVYQYAAGVDAWFTCRYDPITGIANEWNYARACPSAAATICPTSSSQVSTVTATDISTSAASTFTTSSTTPSAMPTATPSSAVLPPDWSELMPCAVDSSTRALASPAYYILSDNTPFACATHCGAKEYALAAVEYGNECYCSNSYANNTPPTAAPASECSMPCAGDVTLTCGAGWRIQVYQSVAPSAALLPAGWSVAMPCAQDSASRVFSGAVLTSLDNNSPAACTAYCGGINKTMAGTEYMSECWCGTGYARNTPPSALDTSNCNSPCTGSSDLTCGGSWAIQIYSLTS